LRKLDKPRIIGLPIKSEAALDPDVPIPTASSAREGCIQRPLLFFPMLRSAEYMSLCQECRVIPEDEHCVFNTLQMAGRLHIQMKEREKEAQPRVTTGNG